MSRDSSNSKDRRSAFGNNHQTVFADPISELAIKNAKYIKQCTELYLAHKNIEELRDFERFVNLERLWVNNNELQRLSHLEANFRLKSIYAQNNQINSVASCARFKFLEDLHLFNNKLTNLDKCLVTLSKLKHLKVLDLFDNPVAQEEDYRLKVIHAMPPALQVLDRQKIKLQEREMAAKLFGKSITPEKRLELKQRMEHPPQRPASKLVGDLSSCTVLLLAEVDAILRRREQALVLPVLEEEQRAKLEASRSLVKHIAPNQKQEGTLLEWERYSLAHALKDEKTGPEGWSLQRVSTIIERCQSLLGKSLCMDPDEFLADLASTYPEYVKHLEGKQDDGNNHVYKPQIVKQHLLVSDWELWDTAKYQQRSNQLFDEAELIRKRLSNPSTSTDAMTSSMEDLHSQILTNAAQAYKLRTLREHALAQTTSRHEIPKNQGNGTSASPALQDSPSTNSLSGGSNPSTISRKDEYQMYCYDCSFSDDSRDSEVNLSKSSLKNSAQSKFGILPHQTARLQASVREQQRGRPSLRLFFTKL